MGCSGHSRKLQSSPDSYHHDSHSHTNIIKDQSNHNLSNFMHHSNSITTSNTNHSSLITGKHHSDSRNGLGCLCVVLRCNLQLRGGCEGVIIPGEWCVVGGGGQIHILGWYFNQNFGCGRRITGFTYSMRAHAYYLILKCKFWRRANDLSHDQLSSSVVAKTQNLLIWGSGLGE